MIATQCVLIRLRILRGESGYATMSVLWMIRILLA